MPIRIPWIFYDPVTDESYELPVNPNSGGEAEINKNVTRKASTAPGGSTIIMEGNSEPQAFSFSGVILTEEQFEAFTDWFTRSRVIRITDDLDRDWYVYLINFKSSRKISRTYPWRHDYSADAVVVR